MNELTNRWSFREFNELPHFYERRMSASYEAADNYLGLFAPSVVSTSLGKLIVYLSGSLLASLFLLATIDDSILLHVKVANYNLLWYIGVLSVAFSVGKGFLPDAKIHKTQYHKNYFEEMNAALEKVATYTHYFPDSWKGLAWKGRIRKEFTTLFVHKSELFVTEVLSVIFAPMILCISLRERAPGICDFIRKTRIEELGLGEVCGFSSFDFDTFKDDRWKEEGENDKVLVNSTLSSRPKARQGKMEKSFFSFKVSLKHEYFCKIDL